jgi:hypothetical protein
MDTSLAPFGQVLRKLCLFKPLQSREPLPGRCCSRALSRDSAPLNLASLQEIVYNLDMEHDIYQSKQRHDLITYITRIRVVYDVSCGTMPYTPCIVHLDIANMFRTNTYDIKIY